MSATPTDLEPAAAADSTETRGLVPSHHLTDSAGARRICGNPARSTFLRWREHDGFPAPLRAPSVREPLWDRREVKAWFAAHTPRRRDG